MRYTSDDQRRYAFRNWLRQELVQLDFYQKRGDRYLVSEFARYADSLGARVEEVSLGRYLRAENPVLPTPESCRELARALDLHPAEVLIAAGYLIPEDFTFSPSVDVSSEELRRQLREIDRYTYVPPAIRTQMKLSIERRLQQIALEPLPRVAESMKGSNGASVPETSAPAQQQAETQRHPSRVGGPHES
jgi:hypothetical protein